MNSEPVILHEGRFLRLMKRGRWEYVERLKATGVVVILAITGAGSLVLTEQYRIPVNQRVIELPAGLAGDGPGDELETLAAAARRELLEETGYEAKEMIALTAGPPSAGLATEIVTILRATGLRRVAAGGGEGDEQIQVHEVPLDQVAGWLQRKLAGGLLVDPKVYAGLYFARSFDER
jgi:ADP-ribose pyrophosphatase